MHPRKERCKKMMRKSSYCLLATPTFITVCLLIGCSRSAPIATFPTPSFSPAPFVTASPTPPSSAPSTVQSPTPSLSPALKSGWVLIERPDDGFTVVIPGTWKALDLSASQYAPMRSYGFVFYALDPESSPATTRAPGSFSVAKKAVATPTTLDYLASVERQSLEAATDTVKPVAIERVQLSFGEAVRMYYQKNMTRAGGQIETMVFLQYEFLKDNDRYLFTFETVPTISEKYLPIFEEIARSFRFTK